MRVTRRTNRKTPRTVDDYLAAVYQKLSQSWVQDTWAKNKRGHACLPYSSAACCWCLSGALISTSRNGKPDGPLARLELQAREVLLTCIKQAKTNVVYTSIPAWNDAPGRTKKDVLRLIDRARALNAKREKAKVSA